MEAVSANTDDSYSRKRVFDEVLGKSRLFSPLIKARFERYRERLAELGTHPLSLCLELEAVSYEGLTALVQRMGDLARAPFAESFGRFSSEIIGRPADYYDDFHFFRSRVFKRHSRKPPAKEKPIPCVVKTMRLMGLDAPRVRVDAPTGRGRAPPRSAPG